MIKVYYKRTEQNLERKIKMQEIFTMKNFIIYIISINLIGFFIMWLDKHKARKGSWRIPEKTLFIIH